MTDDGTRASLTTDTRGYGVVAVVTLLVIAASFAVVFPLGEYAIDDDWAYVRAREPLQYEGRLESLQRNPMSLVGHLAWGWLFTSVFGFSFTVTKLSVVAAFVIECGVFLALLRHFAVPARLAGLAMAALVFDPLHFFHAFQFTTDVPAIMWALLALWLYARALDGTSRSTTGTLLLASTCAGLAFLVRQSGAMVALAVVASLLVSDRRRLASPRFLLAAFGPVAVTIAIFTWWYHTVHGPTRAYIDLQSAVWTWVTHPVASEVARALFVIPIYVGLFALPLTLGVLPTATSLGRRQRALLLVLGVLGGVALLVLGLYAGEVFPYLRNKVTPFGYMRPNEFILGNRPVLWPLGTASVLGGLGLLSALALAASALQLPNVLREPGRRGRWLLLTFVVGQIAYGVVTWPIIFDRHLLMLVPSAILLYCVLVRDVAVVRVSIFGVLLAPLAFASVAGTHDIHAIARTAFRVGEEVVGSGVSPRKVDAGYAFDGWYVFEGQREGAGRATPEDPWWVRRLIRTLDADYVVSLTPSIEFDAGMARVSGPDRELLLTPRLGDRQVVRSYPYRTLWPYGEARLYLLARP